MDISKKDKIYIYKTMKKIRKFETFVNNLSEKNEVFGNLHSSIGQEAIAAGVCYCLDKKDYIAILGEKKVCFLTLCVSPIQKMPLSSSSCTFSSTN